MKNLLILALCLTGSLLQASLLRQLVQHLPQHQAQFAGRRFAGCLALTCPSQKNCKESQCPKAQERVVRFTKFFITNDQRPSFATLLRMDTELSEAQDPEGNTILHHAAANNNFLAVEAIAPRAKPNAVNKLGQTPLMALVLNCLFIKPATNLRIAHHLLKHGASPHIVDINGDKPADRLPAGADPEFRKFIEAATDGDA